MFSEIYPETELFWGLQKHVVSLVPPTQLFPHSLQLAEELLDFGTAGVPCTNQLMALLRKHSETDESMWWLRAIYVVKYRQNIEAFGNLNLSHY